MDKDLIHPSYNICADKSIDLLSLAKIIKQIDGNKASIVIKEKSLNPEYSGNNSRFVNEFGGFDFTKHEQAITELYQWYKDEKNIKLKPKDFS
jgi:nucleoside-diphosphate-sugar epimerase